MLSPQFRPLVVGSVPPFSSNQQRILKDLELLCLVCNYGSAPKEQAKLLIEVSFENIRIK